jgi:hypothetical protein
MQDLSYAGAVLYVSTLFTCLRNVSLFVKRCHFSVRLLLVVGNTNRSPCTTVAMLPACWKKELKSAIDSTRHGLQISIAFVIVAIKEFAFRVMMP